MLNTTVPENLLTDGGEVIGSKEQFTRVQIVVLEAKGKEGRGMGFCHK
jgi:hypothetical protein